MNVESYKIAIQLSLVENVSRAVGLLSTHFRRLDMDVREVETRLKSLAKMAAAGGILAGVGGVGLRALAGPLDEAKRYETELAKFRALGLGDAATQQADKFAKGMNIIGQSATQNVKLLREATAVMGDFSHAQEMMPHLARMKTAVELYSGDGHGQRAEGMMMDLLRVAELRGALKDPETFKRITDLALKAYIASGGTVTPQQLLGAIKTGGVAAKGLSDDAFFFQELHLLQEMGGMRAGTSLMSAYQNLAQGRGTLRSAKVLEEMGLLDPKLIEYTKIGTIKQVKPGALKDSVGFMLSQFDWFEKEVYPKIANLDKNEALLKIGSMFSNRQASNRFSAFYLERLNLQKTAHMARLAMGVDDAATNFGGTLSGKELELHMRYANLQLELGQKILPMAVQGLEELNRVLDRVTQFAREHPTLTKFAAVTFALMSGLALVGGGLLLIKAAFGALGLVNIGAIAAAIGGGGAAAGGATLAGALAALALSPIGLIAGGLVAIAGALWLVNRPLTQWEIDRVKTDGGAQLTPEARARLDDPAVRQQMMGQDRGADRWDRYIAAGARQQAAPRGDIYLDKAKVGEVLWRDLARQMGLPQNGGSQFNYGISLPTVGMR